MYRHESTCKQVRHFRVCGCAALACRSQDLWNYDCIVFIGPFVELVEHLRDLGVT
jgi:hypothetical protein